MVRNTRILLAMKEEVKIPRYVCMMFYVTLLAIGGNIVAALSVGCMGALDGV